MTGETSYAGRAAARADRESWSRIHAREVGGNATQGTTPVADALGAVLAVQALIEAGQLEANASEVRAIDRTAQFLSDAAIKEAVEKF